MRLDPDQLDALADLVADRLAERLAAPAPRPGVLVDAATVGQALGLSAATVRAKARKGVIPARRLGTGPKAPLRFDVDAARAALEAAERPAGGRVAPRRRRAGAGARPDGGWRVEAPSG